MKTIVITRFIILTIAIFNCIIVPYYIGKYVHYLTLNKEQFTKALSISFWITGCHVLIILTFTITIIILSYRYIKNGKL